MKDTTPNAFANREEPIPLLGPVSDDDDDSSTTEPSSAATPQHDKSLTGKESAKKIKDQLKDVGHIHKTEGVGLQDRLFAKYARLPVAADFFQPLS